MATTLNSPGINQTLPAPLSSHEFQLLTWTRRDLEKMTINPQNLEKNCPLDNDKFDQQTVQRCTFSLFERIPTEVFCLILDCLDLKSLTTLRMTNWHLRNLIDNYPSYRAILIHCSSALRALLTTEMARYFTAGAVCTALHESTCHECGQFAPFLDLFTCQRYCLCCILDSTTLLSTITITSAKQLKKYKSHMPVLWSIPGTYGEMQRVYKTRRRLVRLPELPPSRRPLRTTDVISPRQQQIAILKETPYRFMSMLRIPFLDRNTGELDWGVSCQACRLGLRGYARGYRDWKSLFLSTQFHLHLQHCELSRIGRETIQNRGEALDKDCALASTRFLGSRSVYVKLRIESWMKTLI